MRFVNVEHRYSMQPGTLPDKEERENLRRDWVVVLVRHDNNTELPLRIVDVRAEGQYTGRMMEKGSVSGLHFESSNVLRIASRSSLQRG